MTIEGLPQLALVRVLSDGGPYRRDDTLSLAFSDPAIARIVAHRHDDAALETCDKDDIPEAISATLLGAAAPYERGEMVVLSFRNPSVARIVRISTHCAPVISVVPEAAVQTERAPLRFDVSPEPADSPVVRPALLLLLRWSADDARRFISVVDKLFTVDRLGWYRHTLALRLLLADSLMLNGEAAPEANRRLGAVRTIAADALNAPLLSAFMPQFSIDVAWLEAIEPPSLAKAVAALRKSIEPHLSETSLIAHEGEAMLRGTILRRDWDATPPTSLDAFLPLLIPQSALDANVGQRVQEYRTALLELFGQMAQTSATVRLKQMTSDERLWNLAGALQDACGMRVA
jgi:hypothetical protein